MKKYFTTSFRYLWRHRLFTALNIVGLAIGISACWIIYRIVDHEFSYDKNFPNAENTYRLVSGFVFDEKEQYNGGVSKPIFQAVREQFPDVERAVPLFGQWVNAVTVNDASAKPLIIEDQTGVAATDDSYFKMVPYTWLAGSKTTALQQPDKVVLTESRAKQYFPNKKPADILNKTITYYGRDTVIRSVSGVIADIKTPTEFTAKEFCSMPVKPYDLSQWSNTNGSDKVYIQLKPNTNKAAFLKRLEQVVKKKDKEVNEFYHESFEFKRWFELMPLRDSHFSTHINEGDVRKANKPVLYGLMGIALFLLVLACINYINMSIASIPQRSKEIGVRKTLGSSRGQLIQQFLFETIITTLLAGIVSFVLSQLGFWLLKDIIPQGITPFKGVLQLIVFVIVLTLVVMLMAGLYPGWLITRVKAVNIFHKTPFTKNSKGFSLQKTLIVFQFVIALVFITSALVIGNQLHYVLNTNMGFNKDAVVLVDVPWKLLSKKEYKGKQFSLLAELKQLPGIQTIAMGEEPLANGWSSSEYQYVQDGKQPVKRQVFRKNVDTTYLNLYGMKLLAGRNVSASDTTREYVINETAVKAFGFRSPQDAIGKFIGQPEQQQLPIVGVVKDFYMRDFYNTIDPMAFESWKEDLFSFNIKLGNTPAQWQATLKAIEKKWYAFYPPETFKYKFYDEYIEAMYKNEQNFAKLIDLATIISVFISCLGLFGLVVLAAYQRTKEIGIRKVLGASVASILQLLSKEYVYLIVVAIVIATPVAWWAMHQWLQGFAYRIEIEWWIFLLAGVIALVLALITISLQAIKAARANPVESLRTE